MVKLEFVKYAADGSVETFWEPSSTEDYHRDCELGRDYAREAVRASANFEILIPNVMRDMVRRGIWGPVEIGFCYGICDRIP